MRENTGHISLWNRSTWRPRRVLFGRLEGSQVRRWEPRVTEWMQDKTWTILMTITFCFVLGDKQSKVC